MGGTCPDICHSVILHDTIFTFHDYNFKAENIALQIFRGFSALEST